MGYRSLAVTSNGKSDALARVLQELVREGHVDGALVCFLRVQAGRASGAAGGFFRRIQLISSALCSACTTHRV